MHGQAIGLVSTACVCMRCANTLCVHVGESHNTIYSRSNPPCPVNPTAETKNITKTWYGSSNLPVGNGQTGARV